MGSLKTLSHVDHKRTNNVPILLEEEGMKNVRTGAFVGGILNNIEHISFDVKGITNEI